MVTPNKCLTRQDLMSLGTQVGGWAVPGEDVDPTLVSRLMAEIAILESGGPGATCAPPDKHNPIPPDNSYGLWQINMLAHDLKVVAPGATKNTDLYDPLLNAKAAKYILWTQGFSAWSTYDRAKKALGIEEDPNLHDPNTGSTLPPIFDDIGDVISDAADAATAIPNAVKWMVDRISSAEWWKRAGIYVLGFFLLIGGLYLLGRQMS